MSYIYDMISEVDSSVDSLWLALDEENNIISDYALSQGDADSKNGTIQLEYNVIPKQTSENTKVYLVTNDNEMLEMQSNGATEFTLSYEADLSNFDGMKQVVIENDGIKQSETISEFAFFNARYFSIPNYELVFDATIAENDDDEFKFVAELSVLMANNNVDSEIDTAQLEFYVDDELVLTQSLDETNATLIENELEDNENAATELDANGEEIEPSIWDSSNFSFSDLTFPATSEQVCKVYIVINYENGFTQKIELMNTQNSYTGLLYDNTQNCGEIYSVNGSLVMQEIN